MYTESGVNHINRFLAGKAISVASHIALGVDSLDTTGDAAPLISDRYAFAWQALDAPIISTSVVDEYVVYATSDNSSPIGEYLANGMALTFRSDYDQSAQRVRKTIYNNFSLWTGGQTLNSANSPVCWFSADGGMLLNANTTGTLEGTLGLAGYGGTDRISIPVFWYGAAPTGGTLTMEFTFKVAGVDTVYSISSTVTTPNSTHFKFGGVVPSANSNGSLLTTNLNSPQPAAWAKRLDSGTTPANFLNNLSTIWKVRLLWAGSSAKIYLGAPQITPDYDADSSSVVVAWSALNQVVANGPTDSSSAEYRIRGVSL
jgi:hypothetical protein